MLNLPTLISKEFYTTNSGVSFQDVMVRQGVTEAPPKTPFILGFECAGVVAAVADDVDSVKVVYI